MIARLSGGGVGRGMLWGLGEKGEGIDKYKLVVTKQSQGCEAQHRECSQNILIATYSARWYKTYGGITS